MHVLGWNCDTHTYTTCEKVPKNGERKRVVKHLKRKKSQRVRVASEPSPKYLPSSVSVYLDPIRQSYVYVSARVGKSIQWLDGVANSVSGQALRHPL